VCFEHVGEDLLVSGVVGGEGTVNAAIAHGMDRFRPATRGGTV
jgi:hypothetical protein